MAKTPDAALKFMDALVPPATARAATEAQDIQSLIDQQKGGFKVEPWDWDIYSEQVRKAKYDLDEEQVKPYFELNNVLENGVFYAATQLYGITFKERKDIPTYCPWHARLRSVQCRRQLIWRCSTATISSATTSRAAHGWTALLGSPS